MVFLQRTHRILPSDVRRTATAWRVGSVHQILVGALFLPSSLAFFLRLSADDDDAFLMHPV